MKPLVLASSSPRRLELLSLLRIPFTISPALCEEIPQPSLSPSGQVEQLAQQKAQDVLARYPQALVLGADTLVALDQQVFGKPQNEDQAFAMLNALQGKTHSVWTGISLLSATESRCFSQETKVTFCPLSSAQIRGYIAQGESLDKAGGYGIQGMGGAFVQGIAGDYFNVVGLPLSAVAQALGDFGLGLYAQGKGGCF